MGALATKKDDELLDLTQVVDMQGVCRRTVVRRVKDGDLPARRVKRGKYYKWYFSKKEIEEYIEDCY